jgi:magnesium chelatase accessory protein
VRWDDDGRDWPNRDASRFVRAANMRWHVQEMGEGPVALLLHGAGSATHTWRDVAPLLAERFRVVAIDLPGHAFSDTPLPFRMSMPAISRSVAELMTALGHEPAIVVGHSAGAAIGARMCLDRHIAPKRLISLNGAFLPPRGLPGALFLPVARLAATAPFLPVLLASRAADSSIVERLVRDTGSRIDARGVALYTRLARSAGHVGGVLTMMANWDLGALRRDLPALRPHLTLIVGDRDRTILPGEAKVVHGIVANSEIVTLGGVGHLAHEERPAEVALLVTGTAEQTGVLRPAASPA